MSGNRGKGRPKGATNVNTRAFKEAVEAAFQELDGVNGLVKWAKTNPDAFYTTVFPKLAPLQVNHSGQVSVSYEVVSPVRAIDVTEWQAQIPHHRPN